MSVPEQASGQPHCTSRLAVASLVLSCVSLVTLAVPAIPGVICGHIALAKCRQDSQCGGEGLAKAGIIVGYVSIVLSVLMIVVWYAMGRPA